jgi:hypothetical protein
MDPPLKLALRQLCYYIELCLCIVYILSMDWYESEDVPVASEKESRFIV